MHDSYSAKGLQRKCCYDNKGELTAGPFSGITNPDPDVSTLSLFWEGVLPYIQCCVFSDNCFKYQELGTSGSRYIPPNIGKYDLVDKTNNIFKNCIASCLILMKAAMPKTR